MMPSYRWSFLMCLGLAFSNCALATDRAASLEEEEIQQCRRNLHLIYEAIQAYREVNKSLPNAMAELQPKFISQVYLTCPAHRRLGLTSSDIVGWGPDGQITYVYEFSPSPIPNVISGGSARSMRQWKELQMGLLGSGVPIVRCHGHQRGVLNLGFEGEIYESQGLDWEQNFAGLVDMNELTFVKRFAAFTNSKKILLPARAAQAAPNLIDLSGHYNTMLDEVWPGYPGLRPLAGLAPGVTQLGTSSFDLRGAIQLGGILPGLIGYPVAFTNIVIGQAGKAVRLLTATIGTAEPRTLVGTFVFHLEDGGQHEMQLRYGVELAACVERAGVTETVAAPKPLWSARLEDGRSARLFECNWINPVPASRIESLDFLTRERHVGPFLIALTVEPNL